MSSQLSCRGRGVFLGIRSGGVQRGSLNPDPVSDRKCHFSHPFSDLSPKKFMSSLILRLEQQQKIHIHIYKIFLFLSYSFGIEWTMHSSTPVVPLKAIADSRPKWAKSIPVFRPERCKTIPFRASHTYNKLIMAYIREYSPKWQL